jgi:transposase-like protein
MEDRDARYNLRGMVELDDTYIGGKRKPGKRGRGAAGKVPVLVAVESRAKGCGHVALRKVPSVSSSQAKRFLAHRVTHDTLVFSDAFSSYRSVSKELTLYPLTAGSGQRAVEIFPDVHRVIARLKTWIRGTHTHVSRKHLDRYLAEFSYRFNRRFKRRRDTIFDRLVTACCDTQAITYKQLVSALS